MAKKKTKKTRKLTEAQQVQIQAVDSLLNLTGDICKNAIEMRQVPYFMDPASFVIAAVKKLDALSESCDNE